MTEPTGLVPGVDAPAFCLPSSDGKEVCLRDLKGKWVVLYFYPKDNTSGWTTENVEFSGLRTQFESLGAVVLGMSPDSTKSHLKFMERHGIEIPLLSDVEKKVLETYGAWQLRTVCGKESWGVVRSTVLIDPAGKVAKAWPKIAKSAGHAEKVLEELRKLVA